MTAVQPQPTRRTLVMGGLLAAAATAVPSPAGATSVLASTRHTKKAVPTDRATMLRWARDTWHSLMAMTDERTGLPADNIPASLGADERSGYTSPTNIGGLLWSAVAARELGIITPGKCVKICRRTLHTLLQMEHDEASGLYFNWYDEATGQALRTWPTTGERVYPFVSSVDNGWLGAALMVVREAVPGAHKLAGQVFDRIRWDAFYVPDADRPGGLLHGGFFPFDHDRPGGVTRGTHIDGPDVWLTNHHYDTIVSETRITSYLGIATGQMPPEHYFAAWRTFPASCDWSWHEMQPIGETRTYLGIEVYEGAYTYRGMRIVPGWGGSMFEELMPEVFVPESTWAPRSWGRNHPLHVRAQREHGMLEAGYGYWGFSPASDPTGNYREYGLDMLGMKPDGYFSDVEMTPYDAGFGECREGLSPNPDYGDGVVTPHAAFLAMIHEPQEAFENLSRIETELGAYGAGGFYDAVAVVSGRQAQRYLSLDQAMIMGALGNVLGDDVIRRAFSTREVEAALRPVIAMEEFGAGTS